MGDVNGAVQGWYLPKPGRMFAVNVFVKRRNVYSPMASFRNECVRIGNCGCKKARPSRVEFLQLGELVAESQK